MNQKKFRKTKKEYIFQYFIILKYFLYIMVFYIFFTNKEIKTYIEKVI